MNFHCDDRGSAKLNLRLGGRRAEAVQRVLMSQGFPASHLRIVSLGDRQPQCFTRDETCRQNNRRVHFRGRSMNRGIKA